MTRLLLLAAVAVVALSGCTPRLVAPPGRVPLSDRISVDPGGAWVRIVSPDGNAVAGELLAVAPDSVFVLTLDDRVVAVARSTDTARVEAFRGDWQGAASWAGLGALSALSHGFFLVLTAPAWGLTGAAVTYGQSRSGVFYVSDGGTRKGIGPIPDQSWESAARFARFPQGLPAGVVRSRLRALPPTR